VCVCVTVLHAVVANPNYDSVATASVVLPCVMIKETVNGDASLSNSGPGSVPPRIPSQGPVPQQPNFPTSQAQVTTVISRLLVYL